MQEQEKPFAQTPLVDGTAPAPATEPVPDTAADAPQPTPEAASSAKPAEAKPEPESAPTAIPPQRTWEKAPAPVPPMPNVPPYSHTPPQAHQPFTGAVPPQSGAVPPQAHQPFTGAVPPQSGTVPPQAQRPFTGAVPPQSSAVPLQAQRPVTGTVPPQSSAVPPQAQRPVTGAVSPQSSAVPPQAQRPVTGAVPPQSGAVPPQAYQPHPWNTASSYSQPSWYQNQPPRYNGGWQVPPQVPPIPNEPQPKWNAKKDRKAAFWLRIVALLIVVLLGYCIVSDVLLYRREVPASTTSQSEVREDGESHPNVVIQQQEKPELSSDAEGVAEDGSYTVEGVAAAVRPSIVEIRTYADEKGTLLDGTGSGIILSEDGYIITNAHVLTDGKAFTVITADEEEYPASVVGSDNKTDIAVIKVDKTDLPAAVIGDSDEVKLGEAVVAIGNPAGLSGSVTNGIVSGLNRKIRSDATGFDMDCIQTNAAISPGNSGGALVNMYGQVIGITSSKYVNASYEGLGFAITINEVLPIVEELIQQGYVSDRVRIGITFTSLYDEYIQGQFTEAVGMKRTPLELYGLWIQEISQDCDIANTELQVNDVILSVNGQKTETYDDLSAAIADSKANDTVEARCRRYEKNGTFQEFTIQFKLMEDTSGNY